MEADYSNNNCPICFDQISQIFSELECSHMICQICFKNMLSFSNKCPLCLKIFTSYIFKDGSSIIQEALITEEEIYKIDQHKSSLFKDENFECFSKDQIKREIVNYKNICEKINIELFQRRGSNGSEKEYSLYIEILDNLFLAGDLLTLPKFDYKVVMKYLDDSINGIKDLQGRKFQNICVFDDDYEEDLYYCGDFEDKDNLNFKVSIEYIDKKKTNGKKKKKK